jgi:hypothetical protein
LGIRNSASIPASGKNRTRLSRWAVIPVKN